MTSGHRGSHLGDRVGSSLNSLPYSTRQSAMHNPRWQPFVYFTPWPDILRSIGTPRTVVPPPHSGIEGGLNCERCHLSPHRTPIGGCCSHNTIQPRHVAATARSRYSTRPLQHVAATMWHTAAERGSAFYVRALHGRQRPRRNKQYVQIPADELLEVQASSGFNLTFAPFLVIPLASIAAGTVCGVAGGVS